MLKIIPLLVLISIITLGCSKSGDTDSSTKTDMSLFITGQIDLDPRLKKYSRRTDTIFLIARPAAGGPPLAVEKFKGNKYPIQYVLSERNIMIPEAFKPVPVNLSVRVDKDGNPMTRNKGDLLGTFERNPVGVLSRNIDITINSQIR